MPRTDGIPMQFQAAQSGSLLAIYMRVWYFTYAIAMAGIGIVLFVWGPQWLPAGPPWQLPEFGSLLRLSGLGLTGMAILTVPIALAGDPRTRSQALPWFAGLHLLLALGLFDQQYTVWHSPVVSNLLRLSVVVAFGFGYLWMWSRGKVKIAGEDRPARGILDTQEAPAQQLSSAYEEGIRRVAQQEERNRLARDLHDSIKQQIFIVQTAAATAEARFESDPGGAREALARIRESSRDAVTEMDALLTQLRTLPVERTSLVEALRRQCEALEHRTGARVTFTATAMPEAGVVPAVVYENLYRVGQEALHNIARHARASEVQVRLGVEGLHLTLEIVDDGAGFDTNASEQSPGMGLPNMRQRAQDAGALFELWSRPGHGARIRLRVPINFIDVREHRRQAWIQAACLVFVPVYALAEAAYPMLLLGVPISVALGYHLRVLWLVRNNARASAA
ncbi:MAG: sensor histidine kinase [Bryobacterales bacterium]|nr:sensor histidine kinase [Bryobacterales bacterium]